MSDGFTPEDRRMLIETHTKLCLMETNHTKILDDHEKRLRKGEGFRNRIIGLAVGSGIITATTAEVIKVKLMGL